MIKTIIYCFNSIYLLVSRVSSKHMAQARRMEVQLYHELFRLEYDWYFIYKSARANVIISIRGNFFERNK